MRTITRETTGISYNGKRTFAAGTRVYVMPQAVGRAEDHLCAVHPVDECGDSYWTVDDRALGPEE